MPIFKEYHAPKFIAVAFVLAFLAGGYFFLQSHRGETALRAEELQYMRACEDKHRDDIPGTQVAFQGVAADRIGTAQISVRGKMYYTGADGQPASRDFHCEMELGAGPK